DSDNGSDTGAEFVLSKDGIHVQSVILHFVDGERGDSSTLATDSPAFQQDGWIKDPGGPAILNAQPWHNTHKQLDVNDDQLVTAIDVLLVINYLNAKQPNAVP